MSQNARFEPAIQKIIIRLKSKCVYELYVFEALASSTTHVETFKSNYT